MTQSILVLGSVNADHVLTVQQFPRPGETITGSQYRIIPGGKGANQAIACARLGGKTTFKACVGQDAFGHDIVNAFEQEGIDTTLIEPIAGVNTGVALIFVDQHAENCIGISAEANVHLSENSVRRHQQAIESADYLLMQLETPLDGILAAAQLAKASHTEVVLNPAPARPLSDDLLACVDMITPNQTEAEVLTGLSVTDKEGAQRAAKHLHDKGIAKVIITMGKQGAFVSLQTDSLRQQSMVSGFSVAAKDTTAAGDTFNGALLVALAEGLSIEQAIRFSNASAALSVTRMGAQTSIPQREEVDAFLSQPSPM